MRKRTRAVRLRHHPRSAAGYRPGLLRAAVAAAAPATLGRHRVRHCPCTREPARYCDGRPLRRQRSRRRARDAGSFCPCRLPLRSCIKIYMDGSAELAVRRQAFGFLQWAGGAARWSVQVAANRTLQEIVGWRVARRKSWAASAGSGAR
eukprot:356258-Chlamydomonas_euryale.AAC.5